jgi:anti-sigma-K factor RskA
VAAVVVLVAGVAFGIHRTQQPDDHAVSGRISRVFHAGDAETATLRTPRGTVSVATSRDLGQMAVDTRRLRTLPGHRVYQLWTVHAGTATSAGIVPPRADGKVMALPTAGTTVAITVEPAGGSVAPTGRPIVQVDPDTV